MNYTSWSLGTTVLDFSERKTFMRINEKAQSKLTQALVGFLFRGQTHQESRLHLEAKDQEPLERGREQSGSLEYHMHG